MRVRYLDRARTLRAGSTRRRPFRPAVVEDLGRRAVPDASLPAGFIQSVVVRGLNQPSSMEFAPDGRLFVTESAGAVRVIKNGQLLPQPFAVLPADHTASQGLMSLAFDPNFNTNHYVY